MTNTQVTLVQLDNYGPWTVTPEPRREADLQRLQARLYADLVAAFGDRGGYVFFTRFDNMVAVTNGIDRDAHERVQESIRNRYPVTASLSVATDPAPAEALAEASAALQAAGSAQDGDRREVLRGRTLPADAGRDDDVQIAHFDVVDATTRYTDALGAFDSFLLIERGYLALARYLHEVHGSLAFFVGGDNTIAACADLDRGDFEAAIAHVRDAVDLGLQVGVGRGPTAGEAGIAAKHALEACRHNGTRVEVGLPIARGD